MCTPSVGQLIRVSGCLRVALRVAGCFDWTEPRATWFASTVNKARESVKNSPPKCRATCAERSSGAKRQMIHSCVFLLDRRRTNLAFSSQQFCVPPKTFLEISKRDFPEKGVFHFFASGLVLNRITTKTEDRITGAASDGASNAPTRIEE
jgi:hypothetical protein